VLGNTNASMVIDQAVLEMKQLLGVTATSADNATFKLMFQFGGPEAESLKTLRNPDQAYRIELRKTAAALRLIALGTAVCITAGKTLQQLPPRAPHAQSVEMPLVTARDWPELETRGLWGGDSSRNLPFMAERKLNYEENISWMTVDRTTRRGRRLSNPARSNCSRSGRVWASSMRPSCFISKFWKQRHL